MGEIKTEHLESFENALDKALSNSSEPDCWNECDELAFTIDAPSDLLKIYHSRLNDDVTVEKAIFIGQQIDRFHEEWMGEDADRHIESLQNIYSLSSCHDWAFQRLTVVLTIAEKWNDLFAVYDIQVQHKTIKQDKSDLLEEAFQLAKDLANDRVKAADYLNQKIILSPNAKQEALLEKFLLKQNDYTRLIQLWKRRVPSLSKKDQQTTLLKIASAQQEHTQNFSDAISTLREFFGVCDHHGLEDGILLSRKIIANKKLPENLRKGLSNIVILKLKELDRENDCVDILLSSLEVAGPQRAFELHNQIAEHFADNDQSELALEQLAAALKLQPQNKKALDALTYVYQVTQDSIGYNTALVAASQTIESPATKVSLSRLGAKALVEQNKNAEALNALGEIIKIENISRYDLKEASVAMEELLDDDVSTEDKIRVIQDISSQYKDQNDIRHYTQKMSTIAILNEDNKLALQQWERFLDSFPNDAHALNEALLLLEGASAPDTKIKYLTKLCDVDKHTRQDNLAKLASLYEDVEDGKQKALELREVISTEYPSNTDNKNRLSDLYQSLGQWEKLNSHLEVSSEKRIDALADELVQLGHFHINKENNPVKAFEFYKKAFQIKPENKKSLTGLKTCLKEDSIRVEVGKTLESYYLAEGNYNELYDLKTIELEQCNNPLRRKSLLSDVIALSENVEGIEDDVFNYCSELFPLTPHDNVLQERLLKLNENLKRDLDTVAVLDLAFQSTQDSILKTDLCKKARKLLSEQENVEEQWRGNVLNWVGLDPWDNVAWKELFVAHANQENHSVLSDKLLWGIQTRGSLDEECWKELLSSITEKGDLANLSKNLESSSTFLPFAVRSKLLRRLSKWSLKQCESPEESQRLLAEAIKLNPEKIEWLEDLADIQRTNPSSGLLSTIDDLIKVSPFDLDLQYESIELSNAFSEAPETLKRKEEFFKNASLVWNGSIDGSFKRPIVESCKTTFEELKLTYTEKEDYKKLLGLLTRAFSLPFSKKEKQDLRTEAAYVSSTHTGNRAAAIDILESVLRDDPSSLSALETLSDIYEEDGDDLNLFKIKSRLLDCEEEEPKKCLLRLQINKLLADINSSTNPLLMMKQNLEVSPGHTDSIDELLILSEQQQYRAESLQEIEEQVGSLDPETQADTRTRCLKTLGDFYFTEQHKPERALKFYKDLVLVAEDKKTITDIAQIYLATGRSNEALPWLIRSLPNKNKGNRRQTVKKITDIYLSQEQSEEAIQFLNEEINHHPKESNDHRVQLLELFEEQQKWEAYAELQSSSLEFIRDNVQKLNWAHSAISVFKNKLNSPQSALYPAQVAAELSKDIKDKVFYSEALRLNGDIEQAERLVSDILKSNSRLKSRDKAQLFFESGNIARQKGLSDAAFEHYTKAIKLDSANPNILLALAKSSIDQENLPKGEKYLKQLLMLTRRSKSKNNADGMVLVPEVLYELHHVALKKDETEKSEELLESAFDEVLEQPSYVEPFLNALENRNDHRNHRAMLEKLVEFASDSDAKFQYQFKLAQGLRKNAESKPAGFELLCEIIDPNPNKMAWIELAQSWAAEDSKEELFCEKLLQWGESCKFSGHPQLASKLYTEAAKLMEFDIGRAALAKDYYIEALTNEPNHTENWLSLARIYDIENQPEEEISALEQVVDLQGIENTDPQAILKLAKHYSTEKEQTSMAIHYIDSAVKRGLPSQHAYPIYEDAVRTGERNQNLVDAYLRFADAEQSDSLKASALRHQALSSNGTMGSIEEYIEFIESTDLEEASIQQSFPVYEKAARLASDSDSQEHQWIFGGLVEAQLNNDRLSEADTSLEQYRGKFDDKSHTALVLTLVDKTKDQSRKTELLEKFWNLDQSNSDLWQPLVQQHTDSNEFDKCDSILNVVISLDPTQSDLETLYVEQARIKLKLGKDDAAIAILKQAIKDSVSNIEAVKLYEAVLQRPGNEESLADHLRIRFQDILESGDEAVIESEGLRIGGLYQPSNVDEARQIYSRALEKCPESEDLLKAVISNLPEDTDVEVRADYGERLLHVVSEDDLWDLASELVEIRRLLDDREAVKNSLEIAFERCPSDLRVIEALESHLADDESWDALLNLKLHFAEANPSSKTIVSQKLIEAAQIASLHLGDPAKGEEILSNAHSKDSENLDVLIALSDVLAQNNKVEDASEVLNQAIPLCTDEAQTHSLKLAHSNLKSLCGQHDVALLELKELKEHNPELTLPTLLLALKRKQKWANEQYIEDIERHCAFEILALYEENDSHNESRDLLTEWLEEHPDDLEALIKLKEIEITTKNWERVILVCEQLCHSLNGEAQLETAIQLANAAAAIEKPELALVGLKETYAKQPEDDYIRGLLRSHYSKEHADRELAEILLKDAEFATSSNAKYDNLRNAADIFMNRLSDPTAALEPANQAKEIKPNDHDTLIMLADLLIVSGKLDEAIDMLTPAIAAQKRRTPDLATLQYRMAKVSEAQQDPEARLEWLKKAFSVDRRNGYIAADLAKLATEMEDYDLALRPLRAISMMNNPEPLSKSQALLWEAKIEHVKGNTNKALLWTKKALREEPDFAEAQEFLEELS